MIYIQLIILNVIIFKKFDFSPNHYIKKEGKTLSHFSLSQF